MKVRVRAFARFREVFGSEQVFDLPEGAGLDALLKTFAGSCEDGDAVLFDTDEKLRDSVVLMHNRRRVDDAAVGRTVLSDGDEVAVFPPVSGG
ncbi:molybdopterin synthase sulfur carrier subunit [Methanofollis sp. W23]|uniref:MoaD/ThiS family protein n=1 Tax=Methanofollis sp. W23 TaxID=2817849 RepID=UPI001AE6CF95|nr:MoaD/ThiS family protein [Methanofollis sp. W23]MBP2145314.1 molybdopterin synthase sulfur carrier subunit [Methanofollis sp. W23]